MSDRFPSISPDGLRIAASALPRGGRAVQFVGPASGPWQPDPVDVDASGGVWQTSSDLLFVRNKDGAPDNGAILRWDMVTISTFQAPGLEGWSCHNGNFAGWRRGDRLKAITVSEGGHRAGLVDLGGAVILDIDGAEIARGPIAEPRYTGEALVWVQWVDGVRRIFGRRHHGAPTENLSWPFPDDEFWPLAIETPRGLYLMTHGHPEKGRPLWLRPWAVGQTHGHIVAQGFTDRPDARAIEGGDVLVAFSNLVALQRVVVNLAAPLVDVRGPIVIDPDPDPDPDPEERPVQLESKHSALIEEFAGRFGLPGFSKEEGQAWVGKLASTFKARFPAENWGTKRASSSRPLSNESIARPANGRLWGYDLIIGAGAPGQRLEPRAHAEDITDQVFVSVESRDWLAGTGGGTGGGGNSGGGSGGTGGGGTTSLPLEALATPWDVEVDILTRFRAGIHPRDRVHELTDTGLVGSGTMTRGSLAFLIPAQLRVTVAWVQAHGNRAPRDEEWWQLAAPIADAAVADYRRAHPNP